MKGKRKNNLCHINFNNASGNLFIMLGNLCVFSIVGLWAVKLGVLGVVLQEKSNIFAIMELFNCYSELYILSYTLVFGMRHVEALRKANNECQNRGAAFAYYRDWPGGR